MTALTFMVAAVLAPVVIVTAFFALELLAGLSPLPIPFGEPEATRLAIVVPAHDEEAVIERTVIALMPFRVVVVADNCSDATATIAQNAGADVVTRVDEHRRGKGFALAAAREHLSTNPPDVVVIVDADCSIDAAGIRALAHCASSRSRACQATNLLAPDLAGPALVQISTFAFMIKNLIRQRGLQRLAGTVHLTGTGMALPWNIFQRANLGGANIVEDLALGLQLNERSIPPMLVEAATVWSPAASMAGTLVQRRRWEGGYLSTAMKALPAAFARSIKQATLKSFLAALDLAVPPLALLLVLNVIAFTAALAAVLLGAAAWPLIVQLAVGLTAFMAVILAWAVEGRRFASGATLLRLPLYVLWKLPMYVGLARSGAPKEWLRTGRN